MAKPRLSNVLVIGVEWGPQNGTDSRDAANGLANRLLDRFQRGAFKATWAVSDFRSPVTERIRTSTVAQEIALDATVQTPRDHLQSLAFATWLRDRRQRAEQAGIGLRSLVLDPRGHLPYQSIGQLGFRTLRTSGGPVGRAGQPVQPQPLRFGLWGLPVSLRWPPSNRRWPSFWSHPMAYHVQRAALQDSVLHVVFDLSAMAARPAAALEQVDRLLDATRQLRNGQQLYSARLIDVDRLVLRETTARPTRSILRKAA